MNGLADLLLRAAVNWRGLPPVFTQGGLGESGDAFNAAFDRAPFSVGGTDTALAFEFFTGVIFNTPYGDLSTLVLQWLQPAHQWRMVADVPYVPWFGDWTPIPFVGNPGPAYYDYLSPRGGSTAYRILLGPQPLDPEAPPFWGEIGLGYGEYLGGDGFSLAKLQDGRVGYRYRWKGWPIDSSYSAVQWPADEDKPDDVVVRWDGGTERGFTREILDAVGRYVEAERVRERAFPAPAATAAVDNGYVFENWAQGKFGLAVAQDVGRE